MWTFTGDGAEITKHHSFKFPGLSAGGIKGILTSTSGAVYQIRAQRQDLTGKEKRTRNSNNKDRPMVTSELNKRAKHSSRKHCFSSFISRGIGLSLLTACISQLMSCPSLLAKIFCFLKSILKYQTHDQTVFGFTFQDVIPKVLLSPRPQPRSPFPKQFSASEDQDALGLLNAPVSSVPISH